MNKFKKGDIVNVYDGSYSVRVDQFSEHGDPIGLSDSDFEVVGDGECHLVSLWQLSERGGAG